MVPARVSVSDEVAQRGSLHPLTHARVLGKAAWRLRAGMKAVEDVDVGTKEEVAHTKLFARSGQMLPTVERLALVGRDARCDAPRVTVQR